MKCRTCLEILDLNTISCLKEELPIGKSFQEIIQLFIPKMVETNLMGSFICSNCADAVRTFVKFIEKCISTEKCLKERNNEKQDLQNNRKDILKQKYAKEQGKENSNNIENYLNYNPMETDCELFKISSNTSSHENGISLLEDLQFEAQVLKPNRTYSRNKNRFSSKNSSVAKIGQTNIDPISICDDSTTAFTRKCNNSSQMQDMVSDLSAECSRTYKIKPQEEAPVSDFAQCTNCLPKANEENTYTEDMPEKNIDNLLTNRFWRESIENTKNATSYETVDIEDEHLSNALEGGNAKKTYSRYSTSDDLHSINSQVICVTRTNAEIDDFVTKFSKYNVNFIKLQSPRETLRRILFVGHTTDYCSRCNVSFSSEWAMKHHVHENIQIDIPADTEICEKKVAPLSPPVRKFKECPVCKEQFNTNNMLYKHVSSEHKDYFPFGCDKCGAKFKNISSHNYHLKKYQVHQNCKVRKCAQCKEIISRKDLRSHYETHRNWECEICRRRFVSVAHLDNHRLTHKIIKRKPLNPLLCTICGKLKNGESNLRAHMISHSEHRNFLCDICSKSFKRYTEVSMHKKNVHGSQNYECTLCKKKTKSKASMTKHVRLKHSERYSFTCQICGKKFIRGDYYRRHMKKHANFQSVDSNRKKFMHKTRSIVSCKFCHKKYNHIYYLRNHLLRCHLKDAPRSKCRYCNMTFSQVGNRFKHEKRHRNPQLFELTCKVCWCQFRTKEKLEAHSVVHKNSQRHLCDLCGETFPSKHFLAHHKGEVHFNREEVDAARKVLLAEGLGDYIVK